MKFVRLLLMVPLACVCVPTVAAPPNKTNFAITDIKNVDDDFAFMGEYFGFSATRLTDLMGLQVIAGGDGQFAGVLSVGGLPGDGWTGSRRIRLTGRKQDNVVVLVASDVRVVLNEKHARVEAGGKTWGVLDRTVRRSPTLGASPPANGIVLFDGSAPSNLKDAKRTSDGLLQVGFTTAMPVHDFKLHVEFRTPYMPYARQQQRGNSGVYIQRRYEVQILDSFGLAGVANECGGLYRQTPPDVNMCLPPLTWQTYDITFTAARWNGTQKTKNARITVLHNGVPIHDDREIKNKTGAGQKEGPKPLPIHFQM